MDASIAGLLKFQKIDGELVRIEKEIETNKDRNNQILMATVVKEAGQTAELLEKEAEKTNTEFKEVKNIYEANQVRAEKLANVDVDKTTDAELVKLNEELEKILANLNGVEKKLVLLNKKMDELAASYEKAKQNALLARANHAKSKTNFEAFAKLKEEEIKKLITELKEIEKSIDPALLNRYKKLRQDKIFPVVVSYQDSLCGGCRMQISTNLLNKLKAQGYVECENCHRMIYIG